MYVCQLRPAPQSRYSGSVSLSRAPCGKTRIAGPALDRLGEPVVAPVGGCAARQAVQEVDDRVPAMGAVVVARGQDHARVHPRRPARPRRSARRGRGPVAAGGSRAGRAASAATASDQGQVGRLIGTALPGSHNVNVAATCSSETPTYRSGVAAYRRARHRRAPPGLHGVGARARRGPGAERRLPGRRAAGLSLPAAALRPGGALPGRLPAARHPRLA